MLLSRGTACGIRDSWLVTELTTLKIWSNLPLRLLPLLLLLPLPHSLPLLLLLKSCGLIGLKMQNSTQICGNWVYSFENEDDHDIHWEIEAWFDRAHGARFLIWDNNESQPRVQWPQLQLTFPRLSLLARRFLCILPSSAPSERVWSGFGHVIDKNSTTLDSTLAAQIMFLRANQDLLDRIPLS